MMWIATSICDDVSDSIGSLMVAPSFGLNDDDYKQATEPRVYLYIYIYI
jgi:hypothetical protein